MKRFAFALAGCCAAVVLIISCAQDDNPVDNGQDAVPVTITAQPSDVTVYEGQTAAFSVSAAGTSPNYQWQKDGTDIPGATLPSYATPAAVISDSGAIFRCVVSNSKGSVTSDGATLLVRDDSSNSVIRLPGGTFQMGSLSDTNAGPVHDVTLRSFIISRTEITQGEFKRVMNGNPSYFTGDTSLPVDNVTWFSAVLYCNKRSKMEGMDTVYTYTGITGGPCICTDIIGLAMDTDKNGFRLPTEAEWEYACRAGGKTDYYWGAQSPDAYAWYYGNSGDSISGYTPHPVGTKYPNAFSLYDMSGNVWEWCHDWFGGYGNSAQTNPVGPAAGSSRVLRGGSWSNLEKYLSSSYRFSGLPGYHDPQFRGHGFRVVLR